MSDKYIKQEENIKDCPFCGSSVSVERVPLKHYKGRVIFKIKCLNCGCERTLMKNDSVYRTEEEARANAIAQWNERPSPCAAPQEMSVREYVRERDRMCARHNAFCDDCPVLLERMEGEKVLHNCPIWTMRDPEKAVAIVEKWAREHSERNEE